MARELEPTRSRPPVLRRAAAGLIVIAAAALVIHFAIGLIMAVFWTALIIAAIIGVLWALKTLVW